MKYAINAKNLSKNYKIHKKEEGLKGSIKALFKRKYNTLKAVQSVNLQIKQGEIVGFIGPNGAGKTTTLKMLSGLLYPTKGSVKVLGYTPFDKKHSFLKQISLVMGQKNQLFWDLPAIETFNLNKEIYEIPNKQYKQILDELVEMLDLKDILHQQVRKLSLGQRMKCELVASILHTPKVLFLDEPTIGLDVVVQKKLRAFIKLYNKKYNSTIILTSHYMGDIKELCERVVVINNGKIGYDGKLDTLIKKYATTKNITLVFDKAVKRELVDKYGKVLDFDPLKVTFEINREDIPKVASKLLKDLPVDDLDIQETPIEDIIERVFG